jgi:hypothetical protein
MGMKKKIIKGLSYAAFPKSTFAMMNPGKAAFGKAAGWAMEQAMPDRRRKARRRATMAGLGAAAVALPIGFYIGRRMWSGDTTETMG